MAMERKDELTRTLRARFADHEVAVPRGTWEAISGKLALAAASGTDPVCDLLRERFAGHETAVDPGLWEAIEHRAGQADPVNSLLRERFAGHEAEVPTAAWNVIEGRLGQGAAATSGSSLVGWAVGGAAALLLAGGLYLAADRPTTPRTPAPVVEAPAATPPARPAATAPVAAEMPVAATAARAPEHSAETGPRPTATPPGVAVGTATPERTATGPDNGPGAEPGPEPEATAPPVVANVVAPATVPTPVPEQPAAAETTSDPAGRQVVQEVLQELSLGREYAPDNVHGQPEVLSPEPEPEPRETAVPEPVLFIPNVFTPNGDGENEQWVPQGSHYQRVAVRIFSSTNGSMVFSANDLRPWDGNDLHGQPCPGGTYLYAVEVVDLAGRAKAFSNTVNIIR